jgi:hypothetical protein
MDRESLLVAPGSAVVLRVTPSVMYLLLPRDKKACVLLVLYKILVLYLQGAENFGKIIGLGKGKQAAAERRPTHTVCFTIPTDRSKQ